MLSALFRPLALAASGWALSLALAPAARADAVTDALQAAGQAYEAGDLKTTANQLTLATQGVLAAQVALLNAFLPEAPAGYTREINADYASGFAMMGGGSGTEATYTSDAGSFTLDITADNPISAAMAPMLSNPAMMGAMGKTVPIGDLFALQMDDDHSLMTMVDNRILVQMSGGEMEVMLPLFQSIDFAGLAGFDKK